MQIKSAFSKKLDGFLFDALTASTVLLSETISLHTCPPKYLQ